MTTISTDSFVVLRDEHQQIRAVVREFQKSGTTDARKGRLVEQMIELLTVHTYIENVTHHMDEEEKDWFPKGRDGLGRKQLQQLGQELLELRKKAPGEPTQPGALKKTIDAVLS
ncbi:MAG: hemerythrin domain-containing protein [Humibacillus sp.]|nr:hemerythrin domain-containing protein [Humibacillus sp.]MDN5775725.1 hemerythrin domain-containing protein [Humibacillus sp.]